MYATDKYALEGLRSVNDRHVQNRLQLFDNGVDARVGNPADYEVCKKLRYVDPDFLEDGVVKTVSQVTNEYKKELKQAVRRCEGIPIQVSAKPF